MKLQPQDQPRVACQRLARSQQGTIHRGQALALGMSPDSIFRATAREEWSTIFPKVFALMPGTSRWHQQLMGACLWAGSGAVASHRAAAYLHDLDGFSSAPIEIIASGKRTPPPSVVLHRSNLMEVVDRERRLGIPVTTPTRTLLDLGGVADPDRIELALEDALRRGFTSIARMRWAVQRHRMQGRRGLRMIEELVDGLEGSRTPTQSQFETKLYQVLRRASLPLPVKQHPVELEGRRYRIDLAYPHAGLAIEADSFRFHGGRDAWESDRQRRNALTEAGWKVLHITWRNLVERPHVVIEQIRRVLGYPKLFDA